MKKKENESGIMENCERYNGNQSSFHVINTSILLQVHSLFCFKYSLNST